MGISEAFNIRITDYYKPGDYIYYFGGQDDLWLGLWGIIRVYKKKTKNLISISCSDHCSNKDDHCPDKNHYCKGKKLESFI